MVLASQGHSNWPLLSREWAKWELPFAGSLVLVLLLTALNWPSEVWGQVEDDPCKLAPLSLKSSFLEATLATSLAGPKAGRLERVPEMGGVGEPTFPFLY